MGSTIIRTHWPMGWAGVRGFRNSGVALLKFDDTEKILLPSAQLFISVELSLRSVREVK